MTAPPGYAPTHGITGTRPKAETKRETAARIIRAMTAAGMTPHGWQVRSLVATLTANRELPTDEEIVQSLMQAPWYPKPRRRHWRIGEGGGLRTRS